MKVKTVEQFKILKYLEEIFVMKAITVEIVDRYTLKVTDDTGEPANFRLDENGVISID